MRRIKNNCFKVLECFKKKKMRKLELHYLQLTSTFSVASGVICSLRRKNKQEMSVNVSIVKKMDAATGLRFSCTEGYFK